MKHIPFTYLLGWSKEKTFYYGRKTSKGCTPDDLWTTYFSSSSMVAEFRATHGDPDIIEVRKVFPGDPTRCTKWENTVLRRINAKDNLLFLNKSNGDCNWDTTGQVFVIDQHGNKSMVKTNDPRYLSGELVAATKGKPQSSKNKNTVTVKSPAGEYLRISKDDPRYTSGEYVGVNKGKVPVKDINGNRFLVAVDDPRFLAGELAHISKGVSNIKCKGMVTVRDTAGKCFNVPTNDPRYLSGELVAATKGKESKLKGRKVGPYAILKCPHCGKEGGRILKRWHFDNCNYRR